MPSGKGGRRAPDQVSRGGSRSGWLARISGGALALLGSACVFVRPPEELARVRFAECAPHVWGGWHVVWATAETAAPLEIAWWWVEHGRPGRAVDTLNAALTYLPEEPSLLEARGALQHGLRFHRAAEVDFRTLTHLRPEDPRAWRALARIQLGLDLPTRALKAVERARRLGDRSPDSYEVEARALRAAGRPVQAWLAYDEALRRWEADVPELRLEAATVVLSIGNRRPVPDSILRSALEHVEVARRVEPEEARTWLLRGFLLESLGEREEARASYLRASALDGRAPEAWTYLARLARRTGDANLVASLTRHAARLHAENRVPGLVPSPLRVAPGPRVP